MTFIFVLQYDSFIRNLVPVIQNLLTQNFRCTVILYKKPLEHQWITPEIIQLFGVIPYQIMNLSQIKKELLNNFQVLVIGSIGWRFIVSLSNFIQKQQLQTKIATGYIGALLDNHPKGFIKGLNRRSLTHMIWTPGEEAKQTINDTGIVDPKKTRLVATGLPIFDHLFNLKQQFRPKSKKVILFIEQPTYPKSKSERTKLVSLLIKLANAYPDHLVIIKPRFSRKVSHTHRPKYLLQDLLNLFRDLPKNITISDKGLHELFSSAEFALTISSTGGLEALLFDIPVYFINDFCMGENRYGTNYFRTTGGVVSIMDIIAGKKPPINFNAAKVKMLFDGKNGVRLTNEIKLLAESTMS